MSSSAYRRSGSRILHRLTVLAIAGVAIGYAAEASAIDRKPFSGGFVSDARPGYGAERPGYGAERSGYGAERQYYGAENQRSTRKRRDDGYAPRYRASGSFVEFRDDAYDDADLRDGDEFGRERSGGGVFPGFGASTVGSFVYYGDEEANDGDGVAPAAASETRVIDVAAERLDRQPVAPATTSVNYSGATKIIRIASRSADASPAPTENAAPALKPWSEAWQRYCKRAHPGFDPALGTFTGSDGASRFCTGD